MARFFAARLKRVAQSRRAETAIRSAQANQTARPSQQAQRSKIDVMTLLNKFGIGPASGGRGVTHPGKPGHDAAGTKTQSHGHGASMPAAAVGSTRAPAVGIEST